ncbi:MAG: sel1 repeat family protein [Candidatus Thiothrix singaporensis]|uniref:Sel1 repeat family protein n=1 Tax=Candidatus Thiothrix singaporensis TaxID=2799669 RepID=A0A7L6AUC0_9GAMM|nr:MAG: sel1 repeat family protein [Candidatus Thiothrix singaporensis]
MKQNPFLVQKAAEQNDGISQLELANMYAHGLGTVKDSEMASQWLRKANNNGLSTPLALMYLQK